MVVLDVGSNVGYYAVYEAALVGPQPHVYKALLASIKANGLENVVAVRRAVSKASGSLEFAVSSFSNWSRVDVSAGGADLIGKINVEACTVDELVDELGLRRLDLVRMDVEGHEVEVIQGMRETIERFRPVICMELHVGYLGLERSIALLTGLMKTREEGLQNTVRSAEAIRLLPSLVLFLRDFTEGHGEATDSLGLREALHA
jgi:FkbM family methyltransferase